MNKILTIAFVCILTSGLLGQNKNVGINTNNPDPTAVLHLESTNQGLLVPRLSVAQRDAIATPATGLIIYNSDDNQEEIYNGTCWIPSYLKLCTDCDVAINFTNQTYSLDRANTLSLTIPVAITQTTATGQTLTVDLSLVSSFTHESSVTLDQYSISGPGTVNILLQTNVFETSGPHFITVFATCGTTQIAKTVEIDISACQEITISNDQVNYNLASAGVTGTSCVLVKIQDNVGIRSSNTAVASFVGTGIPNNCNVGILNKGYIFGRGGNGPLLMGQNGENGGNALEIGGNVEVRNTGMIYGGGGAGLTVGAFQSIGLGPFNLCFAVGAGGGGGIPNGLGGGDTQGTCSLVVGVWEDGNDAGINYDDFEGAPVDKNVTQSFSFGPVAGVISITARGGGGGDFGESGTASAQPVDFSGTSLEICLSIPFIGTICAPIPGFSSALNALANQINNSVNGSVPGTGGYAIKHTGTVNIPDGNYQSYSIRGLIGN